MTTCYVQSRNFLRCSVQVSNITNSCKKIKRKDKYQACSEPDKALYEIMIFNSENVAWWIKRHFSKRVVRGLNLQGVYRTHLTFSKRDSSGVTLGKPFHPDMLQLKYNCIPKESPRSTLGKAQLKKSHWYRYHMPILDTVGKCLSHLCFRAKMISFFLLSVKVVLWQRENRSLACQWLFIVIFN